MCLIDSERLKYKGSHGPTVHHFPRLLIIVLFQAFPLSTLHERFSIRGLWVIRFRYRSRSSVDPVKKAVQKNKESRNRGHSMN